MTVSLMSNRDQTPNSKLVRVARFPGLRALAWAGDQLYASRAYQLVRARIQDPSRRLVWDSVAAFRPAPWRRFSVMNRLTSRLCRDGFHALAVLPSGGLVAAVPGAIVTLRPSEPEFRCTHTITRGTRPLHITAVPGGAVFWGEYFDNPSARRSPHLRLHRRRRYLERRLHLSQGRHPPRPQHRARPVGKLPLGADRRLRRRMPHPARRLRLQPGRDRTPGQPAGSRGRARSHRRRSLLFLRHSARIELHLPARSHREHCRGSPRSAVLPSTDAASEVTSSSPPWWNRAR